MADAGIGEAMLISAAVGAGAGAASGAASGGGDKIWQNALIGAGIGAAGGAAGAAFAPEAAAGTEATALLGETGSTIPGVTSGTAFETPTTLLGGTADVGGLGGATTPIAGTSSAGLPGAPVDFTGGITSLPTEVAPSTGITSLTPADNAALQNIVETTNVPLQPSPYESTAANVTTTDVPTQTLVPKTTTTAPVAPEAPAGQTNLDQIVQQNRIMQGDWSGVKNASIPGQTPPPSEGGIPQFFKDYGKPLAIAGITGGLGMALKSDSSKYGVPGQQTYTGPLSKIKYDPQKYRPTEAAANVYTPRYAEGGIASLNQDPMNPMSNPIYPQSQQQQTAFATSPQMPNSMRSAMASDYDTRTNSFTGQELPMGYAGGGGINLIRSIQPGGEMGSATADIYGAVQQQKPQWLQNIEPGGFVGAMVPGKMDWEDKQRAEQEAQAAQTAAAAQEAERARFLALNTSMDQQEMARGGIASLGSYSDGGRLLRGPGDGMSDSIPASIGRRQPARLADGEFVVPADVVSHLGNGSTDAGAKQLYSMMDKVRQARTGNHKQGREINPRKYLPA